MKMTRRNFLSASALTLLSCQLAPAARADCLLSDLFHGADTALPPKPLTAKVMDANPFMGRSESNIARIGGCRPCACKIRHLADSRCNL